MEYSHVSYSLALVSGIISFVSPCVLPLVLPYLSYLAGVSFEEMQVSEKGKLSGRIFLTAVFFVAGFSTIFIASGAAASALGRTIILYRDWLNSLAGITIIVMGFHFLGIFKISFLHREARLEVNKPVGLWGAYVMGLAFAFGWTPCMGPILATILVMAGNGDSLKDGALLLTVYSLGLGIPFILSAVLIRPFTSFLNKFRNAYGIIEKTMGVLLIGTGIMFLLRWNTSLSFWLLDHYPGLVTFEEKVVEWFQ